MLFVLTMAPSTTGVHLPMKRCGSFLHWTTRRVNRVSMWNIRQHWHLLLLELAETLRVRFPETERCRTRGVLHRNSSLQATGVLSVGSPVSPGDECDLIVREELMYQEARRLENEIEVALAARDAVELSSLLEVARHSLDASRIATLRVELDTLFSVTTDDKPVQ